MSILSLAELLPGVDNGFVLLLLSVGLGLLGFLAGRLLCSFVLWLSEEVWGLSPWLVVLILVGIVLGLCYGSKLLPEVDVLNYKNE